MNYSIVNIFDNQNTFPIFLNNNDTALDGLDCPDRFKLVLLKEGFISLNLGKSSIVLTSQSILCLNDMDKPVIEQNNSFNTISFYFHPQIINSKFDFDILHSQNSGFSGTDQRDRSSLRPFLEKCENYNGFFNIEHEAFVKLVGIFENINNEILTQKDQYWFFRISAMIRQAIYNLQEMFFCIESNKIISIADNSENDIGPIIDYLKLNYFQKIKIEELAKTFCLNRTTLNEKFIKETGMTVISFLINIRLKEAALLLKDTNLRVIDVMERVGFNDSKHFSSAFKKFTGLTPSQYQKQIMG